MIEPGDSERSAEENLKPQRPGRPFRGQKPGVDVAQMIEVKGNMLRFVGEDARTDLVQNRIARSAFQQPIVSRSDQLRDEEHLDFKIEPESAPGETEKLMRPVARDEVAAEPRDEKLEKARMLRLFGDEELERAAIGRIFRFFLLRPAEKVAAAAAFAELEMGERGGE